MKREWILLAVLILFGVAYPLKAAGPMTWEFRDGRWQQLPAAPTTQPTLQDEELDRIEQLLAAGQWKPARVAVLRWLKQNPGSPVRDKALLLIGEVYYQGDDRIRSFYHLDELLDNYPESRLFYPALEKQYKIADEYLEGRKDKFLGMRIVNRDTEAVEMLYRIQQTSPGSPLAERALLRTADHYYADLQYDLAADAYAMYAKNYPRSPIVPKVLLRRAFSSLAQFRGIRFDPTPLIDARSQLLDLAQQYPKLAEEENVGVVIEKIDRTFASKLFGLADYYRRTHEPVAAVYAYRLLIKTYPTSPEAASARKWLDKMPASALATPEPPANGFSPTAPESLIR